MVLQLSTFSADSGHLCGGFEKKVLDQEINRHPAGFVWSLEPEKLKHSLYQLNSIHHNIKFTEETRQYSVLPSFKFVFIGDPMALCSRMITGNHPCELLCLTSGTHSDPSNAHAFVSTLVQEVRALYKCVYSQRQICQTVSTAGGIWLQEGKILFAYMRMSARPTNTWAGWCLGAELNALVSSKWPTFNRLTTLLSFTLFLTNKSFPTYCCTRSKLRFKEQPAMFFIVVCRLLFWPLNLTQQKCGLCELVHHKMPISA